MKDIKVVIGANYGDEGKGLMVDYFCNHSPYNKPILNVRFNGGSHAKHTVVIPDGRRHEFSHIGAGSFNENVITYLSSFFLVNPFHFETEYKQLINKGLSLLNSVWQWLSNDSPIILVDCLALKSL